MFRKYVEIYNTLNLEKFFAAKEILASNSIQYKDTSVNNQLRLALNNIVEIIIYYLVMEL